MNKLLISKVLASNLGISHSESQKITEEFITLIIKNSKSKKIKLSRFGTFYIHKSPNRLGRNPKTKESYIIPSFNKLAFKASNKTKEILN